MTTLAEDLTKLEALKRRAERAGRYKKSRDQAFKQWQSHCVDRMDAEDSRRFGTDTTLFTLEDERVKGDVVDRRRYVRWCLEQDEAIQAFVEYASTTKFDLAAFTNALYEAIQSTSMVHMTPDQGVANSLVKSALDDDPKNPPLPPGLDFRPDPYIRQRRS